jgi:hypothetical protein
VLVDRGGEATPIETRALALTRELFHLWHQCRDGPQGTSDRAALQQALTSVQDGFEHLLDDGQRSADPKTAWCSHSLGWMAWPLGV